MQQQIVYFDKNDTHFLEDEHGLNVIETFDFGEDCACVVETEQNLAELYNLDSRIFDVDTNFEFETHDIDLMDADGIATIDDVKEMHNASENISGEGMTAAITDSGIDTEHPLFDGVDVTKVNLTDSTNVDTVGHGTAVAGQIIQLAPDAELIMLRIFGDRGRTSLRTVLRAYEWVIQNAERVDVLNMSIGSSQNSRRLNSIHNRVERKGVKTVVSAGNSGGPSGSPATASQAFSVGACDETGRMASFSSYNPSGPKNPEVTAIGKNNKLAKSRNAEIGRVINDNYVKASGTSFSAPEVAGLVLSLLSEGVDKPRKDLANYAQQMDSNKAGAGLADYARSLENGESTDDGPVVKTADVWEFAGGDVFYVNGDYLEDGEYEVEIRKDDDGNQVFEFRLA